MHHQIVLHFAQLCVFLNLSGVLSFILSLSTQQLREQPEKHKNVNFITLNFPCLDARGSDALWWASPTERTPFSPLPQARRRAQTSQWMRTGRPLKAQRLWSLSMPRNPPSSPTCATSPATRSRSMPVTTRPTPPAAAWQRMSAPAQCLKVRRPDRSFISITQEWRSCTLCNKITSNLVPTDTSQPLTVRNFGCVLQVGSFC